MFMDDYGWREEFKYWITREQSERIISRLENFIEPDPFTERGSAQYTVRSIYYDTPSLDFYRHKIEHYKIRKKLRVRGYNHTDPDDEIFLEIKHKIGRKVLKERALLRMGQIHSLLNEPDEEIADTPVSGRDSHIAQTRFLWLMKRLGLVPTLLVVYDRRAFIGRSNDRIRVTFDHSVRSIPFPDIDCLNRDKGLLVVTGDAVILELKFSGSMPHWMRSLVRSERLKPTSISKYCICLESWMQAFRFGSEHFHQRVERGELS